MADHHIMSNVELASFVEEGPVDIELNYEGFLGAVLMLAFTLHDGVKLVYLVDYCDAVASIGQLAWLYDPDVPHGTAYGQSILLISFLLADNGLPLLVIADESFVLRVFGAFFDVESKGNDLEELSIGEFVVLFQIIEEGLFVSEIEIVGQVVMYSFLFISLLFQFQDFLPLP
jgi:hypothetical protein